MKDAIGYIRVSTDEQAENGYGKDAQREHIEDYAYRNNYKIVRWVEEDGVSRADNSPPKLLEIIYGDDTTNPPIEALIAARTDRVGGIIENFYFYKYMLRKKNIEIISATENIAALGKYGSMMETFILNMAEMERDNIMVRTSGGRKQKAAQGGYAGGRAPYGYEVDRGQLVINEEEAQAVRRMFELRDQGMTYKEVEEILNGEGYRRRNGNPFHFSGIQQMISNRRTYEGEYKYGKDGEWVEGQHEAILNRRGDR